MRTDGRICSFDPLVFSLFKNCKTSSTVTSFHQRDAGLFWRLALPWEGLLRDRSVISSTASWLNVRIHQQIASFAKYQNYSLIEQWNTLIIFPQSKFYSILALIHHHPLNATEKNNTCWKKCLNEEEDHTVTLLD